MIKIRGVDRVVKRVVGLLRGCVDRVCQSV